MPEEAKDYTSSPFEDVMIDIETMSLHPHKALIVSVGAIEFMWQNEFLIGAKRLWCPDVVEQLMYGRRVDAGTQKFWREQPQAAADHFLHPPVTLICTQMLIELRDFCAGRKRIWANGTQFDLSNLIGLAEDVGEGRAMWHYQAPRDMRTFVLENPSHVDMGDALDYIEANKLVAHNPVDDCVRQAYSVWGHRR
jgi:hypothetical protein